MTQVIKPKCDTTSLVEVLCVTMLGPIKIVIEHSKQGEDSIKIKDNAYTISIVSKLDPVWQSHTGSTIGQYILLRLDTSYNTFADVLFDIKSIYKTDIRAKIIDHLGTIAKRCSYRILKYVRYGFISLTYPFNNIKISFRLLPNNPVNYNHYDKADVYVDISGTYNNGLFMIESIAKLFTEYKIDNIESCIKHILDHYEKIKPKKDNIRLLLLNESIWSND